MREQTNESGDPPPPLSISLPQTSESPYSLSLSLETGTYRESVTNLFWFVDNLPFHMQTPQVTVSNVNAPN